MFSNDIDVGLGHDGVCSEITLFVSGAWAATGSESDGDK
jgi:hypothetical protein